MNEEWEEHSGNSPIDLIHMEELEVLQIVKNRKTTGLCYIH